MKEIEKDVLNKEWMFERVTLEIVKRDWNQDMLKVVLYREIEGTDLVFIPIVETDIATLRFLPAMLLVYEISAEELMEQAIKNMMKEKWNINYNLHGLCYISPSACAFIPEKISTCYGDDEGIYILPFTKKGVELIRESVMEKEEVLEAFQGSEEDLRDLGVLTEENRLGNTVYLFKNGKYSIL